MPLSMDQACAETVSHSATLRGNNKIEVVFRHIKLQILHYFFTCAAGKTYYVSEIWSFRWRNIGNCLPWSLLEHLYNSTEQLGYGHLPTSPWSVFCAYTVFAQQLLETGKVQYSAFHNRRAMTCKRSTALTAKQISATILFKEMWFHTPTAHLWGCLDVHAACPTNRTRKCKSIKTARARPCKKMLSPFQKIAFNKDRWRAFF